MDLDKQPLFNRKLIQVAGVHDLAEARLLVEEGVDLVGIPLRLPVHAEDLTDEEAASIGRALPGRVCLITYLEDAREICDLVRFLKVDCVQLHGRVPSATLPEIRRRMPHLTIIKSLVVGKLPIGELESEMRSLAPGVDAFITDTFNPETGAEGATGLTHDWNYSLRLRQQCPRPLILAGGLRAGNVAQAIAAVSPAGVDVHTGVEDAAGRKSRKQVRAFVQAARTAWAPA